MLLLVFRIYCYGFHNLFDYILSHIFSVLIRTLLSFSYEAFTFYTKITELFQIKFISTIFPRSSQYPGYDLATTPGSLIITSLNRATGAKAMAMR